MLHVGVGLPHDVLDREDQDQSWLTGGGQMGELIRAFDWASTLLGPLAAWPQSLRSALSIGLGSRFPIVIYWGPDLVVLYNDAYAEILGKKHPTALGRPCREVWSEIWDVIGPMLDRVLTLGDATWSEDQLLLLERRGYPEECYFSFSFSPVRGANGAVDGIFTAVIENTGRVLGERRLRTLRDLGASLAEAASAEEACSIAASVLADNRADVPFALFYLTDQPAGQGTLVATAGGDSAIVAPASFALDHLGEVGGWPLARVCRSGETAQVGALSASALVLPLATVGSECAGVVVVGVSPHRELDQEYRGFFELVARRVATAIAEVRAYDAERRRAEALAELDRAKTAFFSNVSHEFRTPLTLMLGPVEDMRRRGDADGQLQVVHRNSLRLLRLVNTMLDFSRIEAGRARANYQATDLAGFTADVASSFRSACERAGLHLTVDCHTLPANAAAFVDREMWEKIVLNLVSNAFKFTLQGGIEVRLAAIDGKARLTVRDTGAGIPPDEIPRMFERFHRVAQTQGRTHEGTGIGLALVQELVKLHGGEVKVESALGKGSCFTVSIPLGSSHLDANHIRAETGLNSTARGAAAFVEEALRWLPDSGRDPDLGFDPLTQESGPAKLFGPRPRVIWADDNADMRAYVARLLRDRCDVEAFPDGEAALQTALKNPPDLVLCDVMMPRLDGVGLLRALRADPRTAHCAVILISARAGEENRIEGMQAGADDYIIKPFNAAELVARVETRANMARMRRAEEERRAADLVAMERLYQLGNRCAQAGDDFETCLDEIVATAIAITNADKGNVQLLDAESGTLRIAAQRGFGEPFLKVFAEAAAGEAQAADRILVPDITRSEMFAGQPSLDVLLSEGVRAVQSTPVVSSSGQVFGMISTYFREARQPGARDLHLMDLLARQTADHLERRRAEIALRHRTQQFETLIDQAPLGVFLVDADFKIRSVNPVAMPVFGDIRGGIIGRDFDEIIHILWQQDYANEIVGIFRHTLATGEPYVTPERIETRKDRGMTEYYEWRIDRIVLPDGRYGIVCYFRDISAQVQARETQQLLVDELNHRVKNTLASVQAIVQHTLRTTKNPDDFAASFTGRIQAMSRVHSLLSSGSWKGADLRDVIRDQLLMGPVDETRFTAWGPPVHLEPQAAQHLALMLHELGTNSIKYGALSRVDGYVTVSWTVADALLRLQWMERGGPPVSTPLRRGFGTTLIEQSARGEGGDARMLVDADGLSWEINLPLPRSSAAPRKANAAAPSGGKQAAERPRAAPDQAPRFAGKRFLVVEDEPLVALDIVAGLQRAGAEAVGPVGTPERALAIIEKEPINGALLDANLRGRPVDDIAAALSRRCVPFAFVTGYGRESLPKAFAKAPMLSKPFTEAQLLEAADDLVDRRAATVRLRV